MWCDCIWRGCGDIEMTMLGVVLMEAVGIAIIIVIIIILRQWCGWIRIQRYSSTRYGRLIVQVFRRRCKIHMIMIVVMS